MNPFAPLRLIALTDLEQAPAQVLLERWERLAAAAAPGTVAVDLRAPHAPARRLVELGSGLARMARAHGQRLLVNDRLDLARLLGADAVHLREDSVASADARRYIPGVPLLRACHQPSEVSSVQADAVLLSPILEARKGNAPLGLDALRRARRLLEDAGQGGRLFALGGIDARRAPDCIAAGAHGVAALGAALGAESATALLRSLGIERG